MNPGRADDHVDRQLARDPNHLRDLVSRLHSGREQHVGAGLGKSGQAPQRLGEAAGVFAPDRLAARGQQDFFAAGVDRGARRAQARDRLAQGIERRIAVAGEILDRKAGDARADAKPHALIDAFGVAGEAGLEVGVERKVDRGREFADVAESIGAGDGAIGQSRRKGHARARGRQRGKAERGEIFRRADVVWVRHHEAAGRAVQFGEAVALLGGGRRHRAVLGMSSERRTFWRPAASKLPGASQRS